MDKGSMTLIIFFEDPFWVGVFERKSQNQLKVCKVIFGQEPKDYEIYDYVLKNYHRLTFSPAVKVLKQEKKLNPKRQQREIQKMIKKEGISTKSQQALKLQQEQIKVNKKKYKRENKKNMKKHRFDLLQQKRKEKHKGK